MVEYQFREPARVRFLNTDTALSPTTHFRVRVNTFHVRVDTFDFANVTVEIDPSADHKHIENTFDGYDVQRHARCAEHNFM
jgi:hypothetical protein